MKRAIPCVLVFCLPIFLALQQPPAKEPKGIPVPSNLQLLIQNADLKLKNAQLERAYLDLQVRVMLKVPTEYAYNEQTSEYEPPKKEEPKKQEPKKEESKK
jgi:hypothetical protein